MRRYTPSEAGHELGKSAGLDNITQSLFDQDDHMDMYLWMTIHRPRRINYCEREELRNQAINNTYTLFDNQEGKRHLLRSLAMDTAKGGWVHETIAEEGTLFAIGERFADVDKDDLDIDVVGGIVGAQLINYRSRYPILAKSRFEEYGFRTYAEACSFVGGYVLSKISELMDRRIWGKEPGYTIDSDGIEERVTISGDFHGDFRMSKNRHMQVDITSPIGTHSEYGPIREASVAGYHSVEPYITAGFIEHELVTKGEEATKTLLLEFKYVTDEVMGDSEQRKPGLVAFGDYGDSMAEIYAMTGIRLIIEDGEYRERRAKRNTILSEPYLPQSKHLFEMISQGEGVVFRNRHEDSDAEYPEIYIPREQFPDMYRALLEQAAGALGRTSIGNHLAVVEQASEILSGD